MKVIKIPCIFFMLMTMLSSWRFTTEGIPVLYNTELDKRRDESVTDYVYDPS